jgi:hypothetical protein
LMLSLLHMPITPQSWPKRCASRSAFANTFTELRARSSRSFRPSRVILP